MSRAARLPAWYGQHGRHDLPWRHTRDRWAVLVSEVMLQQTQVSRVLEAWPPFMQRFPTPGSMAAVSPGEVIVAWGRLGYPRRARRLWETATIVAAHGWPHDLRVLPGVGRYTAAALLAQADGADVPAVEVNVRRVVERCSGKRLGPGDAEEAMIRVGHPLHGRDRLLALMDVGALLCRPADPGCAACPLQRRCATRGALPGETRSRQTAFEGSFRQRRGRVMERLREAHAIAAGDLDADVLESLVADGLAVTDGTHAQLP